MHLTYGMFQRLGDDLGDFEACNAVRFFVPLFSTDTCLNRHSSSQSFAFPSFPGRSISVSAFITSIHLSDNSICPPLLFAVSA
jgi:hypothetical protein